MKTTLFTTCNIDGTKTGEAYIVSQNVLSVQECLINNIHICQVNLKGRIDPMLIKSNARYALKQLGLDFIDARSS